MDLSLSDSDEINGENAAGEHTEESATVKTSSDDVDILGEEVESVMKFTKKDNENSLSTVISHRIFNEFDIGQTTNLNGEYVQNITLQGELLTALMAFIRDKFPQLKQMSSEEIPGHVITDSPG